MGDADVHLVQLFGLVPHVLASVQDRFGSVELRALPPFPASLVLSGAARSLLRGANKTIELTKKPNH